MPYPYNPAPYGATYSNPYVDRYNAMTAQNFSGAAQSYGGQITRVNGRNGAEAFRMTPNASVLLMDENDPIVWLKVSDGAGYCTLTPYSISPYQAAAPVDVNSLENRVKRLEELINGKSDVANVERSVSASEQ